MAKPKKEIEVLFNKRFVEKSITGCYRSTQRIIDYYMHFQITPFRITSKATYALEHGRVCYSLNYSKDEIYSVIAELIKNKLQEGVPENEICVVAPQWELLFPISRKMGELLPDVSFDAPDITPIKYEEFNVFYKIVRLTFTPVGKKISLRKRLATEILDILGNDYHIHVPENIDCYSILKTIASIKTQSTKGTEYLDQAIMRILKMLKIRLGDYSELSRTYTDYFEKITDRMQRYSLPDDIEIFKKTFQEKEGVVVTSCYKVKGEEYDTVIAYGLLEGKIPHWEAIFKNRLSLNFTPWIYRKCGKFNSKNDSRPCMGASAILKSVDFTDFAENVKTIALTQKLYQFGHAIWCERSVGELITYLLLDWKGLFTCIR